VKRKFATSLVLLLALNLVVKPFWIFGIDRSVQNVVGAAEYGLFFALFNFSILLNIILDFGLTNFNNREISRHSQLLPRYFSNMFVLKLMMAAVYLIVSFSLALLVGYSGRQLWILGFLVFNQFLSSFILYIRSNISGLQLFKTDSIVSVTDRVLMIALCGFLLWGPFKESFRIEWFVYAQTIAYALTALITFVIVYSKSEFFQPKFDRGFFIVIFKQSYPYALLVLLMSFYYRVDGVMLERLLPDGSIQSGVYAQAFRLLDAANMVPFLFASLLLPIFSRMLKEGEPIAPLLRFAFNILMVISISFAFACIIYRKPIMDTLYVHHPDESSVVLAILMISFIFISLSYIFGTLLTANGSLRHLNIISFVGVVINLSLNLLLIPSFKVVGAAVASLFTQFFMAAMQTFISYRTFRIKLRLSGVLSFILFLFGGLFITYTCWRFFDLWVVGFVVSISACIFLAFTVRFIRIKEIINLIFEKQSI
jgi:O-antigen/teichoic acid export membrane protein